MRGKSDRMAGDSHQFLAILRAAATTGTLATVTMDAAMVAAAAAGGQAFESQRLSPQIIGRWAAGLLRGEFRHKDIAAEKPVPGELALGMATHYATGIVLTGAFLLAAGRRDRLFASRWDTGRRALVQEKRGGWLGRCWWAISPLGSG
jgi:hypothetical protein